jgi:hypothetical protein
MKVTHPICVYGVKNNGIWKYSNALATVLNIINWCTIVICVEVTGSEFSIQKDQMPASFQPSWVAQPADFCEIRSVDSGSYIPKATRLQTVSDLELQDSNSDLFSWRHLSLRPNSGAARWSKHCKLLQWIRHSCIMCVNVYFFRRSYLTMLLW